jgi:hypothetical protein
LFKDVPLSEILFAVSFFEQSVKSFPGGCLGSLIVDVESDAIGNFKAAIGDTGLTIYDKYKEYFVIDSRVLDKNMPTIMSDKNFFRDFMLLFQKHNSKYFYNRIDPLHEVNEVFKPLHYRI